MNIINDSDLPLYLQIAEHLKEEILSGMRKPGDKLPSIRKLAKDLQISTITTMKAYEELGKQGFIIPMRGKGFYVNSYDSEMVCEQHLRKIEEHLLSAIADAKKVNISGDYLCTILKQLIKESNI